MAARRVRNQDGVPIATDSVYFVKNMACPNQKPGTPLSTAPPATTAAPRTSSAAPPATTAAPPATTAAPVVVPTPVAKPNPLNIANTLTGGVLGDVLNG